MIHQIPVELYAPLNICNRICKTYDQSLISGSQDTLVEYVPMSNWSQKSWLPKVVSILVAFRTSIVQLLEITQPIDQILVSESHT